MVSVSGAGQDGSELSCQQCCVRAKTSPLMSLPLAEVRDGAGQESLEWELEPGIWAVDYAR